MKLFRITDSINIQYFYANLPKREVFNFLKKIFSIILAQVHEIHTFSEDQMQQ